MVEFYVTFDWQEKHHLAIVLAHGRPERLQFSSSDDLYEAMNALGRGWELYGAMEVPYKVPSEWLETMAEIGADKRFRKPDWSLVTGRTFPDLASGP